MAPQKTLPSDQSVGEFMSGISRDTLRDDARKLCDLLAELTGEEPAMWGESIVGFG